MTATTVLTLCGSLRHGSFNAAILRQLPELAPPGVHFQPAETDDIPLYNDDVYSVGFPTPVKRLRDQIAAADAVLIASPENNYSIPGVLKNAIDWVSRPPDQPFNGKPVAILSASPGRFGGVRMQAHLRQVLMCLNAQLVIKPEVCIGQVDQKLDDEGWLTDDFTRRQVGELLTSLLSVHKRLQADV